MMSWIIAWLTMFLLLYVTSRTKAGNVIIYYTTWLLVLLLVVSHYKQWISLLSSGGL